MTTYGTGLFKGTASYYARFRPVYPPALVRLLIQSLSLDGKGRMLDLACGTGQLALRFSDWFEHIIGLDQEEEMISEAKRLQEIQRMTNVDWILDDLASVQDQLMSPLRLVLIAKAFHWLDRPQNVRAPIPCFNKRRRCCDY